MNIWVSEQQVAALEAAVLAAVGARRGDALLELAWALRERDSSRAAGLLEEARRLDDPGLASASAPASAPAWQTLEARVYAALLRGELALLFCRLDEADDGLNRAKSMLFGVPRAELEGAVLLFEAAIAKSRGQSSTEVQAYRAAWRCFERAGEPARAELARGMLAYRVATNPECSELGDGITDQLERPDWTAPSADAAACVEWTAARALWLFRREPALSAEFFTKASDMALQMGMIRQSAVCAMNAGTALQGLADFEGAAACFEATQACARRTGWPVLVGASQTRIGRLLRELGQLSLSHAALEEALVAMAPAPAELNKAAAHSELALTLLSMGHANDAVEHMQTAIAINRAVASAGNLCLNLIAMCRIMSSANRPDAALAAIHEAQVMVQQLGFRTLAVGVTDSLAELHRRHPLAPPHGMTAPSAAAHYAEATLRLGLAIEGWKPPAALYVTLAEVWSQARDFERAYGYASKALRAREDEASLSLSRPLALLRLLHPDGMAHSAAAEAAEAAAAASGAVGEPQALSSKLLSPKEREVLRLLARGCPNKEIAQTLEVSPETVKTHLRNIFVKLRAGSRRHALVRARDLGLSLGV